MDTAAQWPQDIVVKPMEEMVATCPRPPSSSSSVERKLRPHKEQALNCPRCNSTNTKFCYYNNYSLSQPRYFCKTCRRYWTEGGSLRNIPVGGGSRKNKRSASSSSSYNSNSSPNSFLSSNNSSKKLPDLVPGPQQQQQQQQNPKMNFLEPRDLDLGFSIHNPHHHNDFKAITDMIQVPNFENIPSFNGGIRTSLELQNPSSFNYAFIPLPPVTSASGADQTAVFGSGFPNLPDHPFKSSPLDFSLDHGLGGSFGSFQGVQEANGNNNNSNNGNNKLLFPFENLKQDRPSNANGDDGEPENRDNQNGDSSAGYWNGVIGGGSW